MYKEIHTYLEGNEGYFRPLLKLSEELKQIPVVLVAVFLNFA